MPSAPPSPPPSSRPPAQPEAPRHAHAAVGSRIASRYRLLHTLGSGGTSQVWCAITEATGAHVAIKLRDDAAHEHAERTLERFREEARVTGLAAKGSEHVVHVLDVGVDDGTPFLVLERLNARTLAQELDRVGVLAPARLAALFAQIAEALASLHDAGFVHGDVKPANLLVHGGPAGQLVKVADFGAASPIGHAPAGGPPTPALGSSAYLSPEQLAGAPLDARADVWSRGVVAYEALTGWPPFGAPTGAALAEAIATRPHLAASKRRASLPRALDAWLDRALEKRPSERFADAREMAAALESALASASPTPTP